MQTRLKLWHVIVLVMVLAPISVWGADTMLSALSALTGANVASGDKIPIVDIDDTTHGAGGTAKTITANELKTNYINTAPVWAAGSASAGTWPILSSGTLMTTAEAGAIERDANTFYATTDAGNRAVLGGFQAVRLAAARSLTSSTAEQAIFDAANDTLTLETGYYIFRCELGMTSMSATSGNAAFDFIGAGSATAADILYHVVGVDGASNAAAAQTGSWAVAQQTAASMVTAGTGTAMVATITGNFEITGAGTIIPSVTLVTAAAASVAAGTYCRFSRFGATGVTSVGQWG